MKSKKFLVFLCMVFLFIILIGCESQTENNNNNSDAPQLIGPIKIGGNFELSGQLSEFGLKGQNGVKLAIKQVNEKGGILGAKVEYFEADNKSNDQESAAVVEKLVDQDNVIGIIGPMTNLNTLAAATVATQKEVVLITPTGTSTLITVGENGLNEWLFRACFIDAYQGELAALFSYHNLESKTAAVVIDQSSEYSKRLAEAFQTKFSSLGGSMVISEYYTGGQDKDFTSIINSIEQKNPDIIFLPGFYGEAGLFINQARNAGIIVPILGGDGWGTGPIVEVAGQEALNNTYYLEHCAVSDPAIADFIVAYKEEYYQDADSFSILGYDAALLLLTAIEKAQSTESDKIKAALESLTDFEGISGTFIIDPETHNPRKSAAVIKFEDGKKVFETRVNPQ
ncbi:MAG: ABC transporter substrate-binding protein [Peptococcaceae bacterium]|nr:ABC transporter substrate-binding protein [Peptococcaceae bacterium]